MPNELNLRQPAIKLKIQGANAPSPEAGMGRFLQGTLKTAALIASLLLLVYLVWGGFEWLTSEGDKNKIENARNKMTQAVIGMIILLSSVAIFVLIQKVAGINIIQFQ